MTAFTLQNYISPEATFTDWLNIFIFVIADNVQY